MSTNPYGEPTGVPTGYPTQPTGSSGLAIASLICGILSIVTCCCLLISVPTSLGALVTGGLALQNPNAGGKGMAIAGVVMGGISLVWLIFVIVVNLANPDLAKQIQQMQQMQPNQ